MKLYFIRHAPTKSNLTGKMVKNYDNAKIIKTDTTIWETTIGKYIPIEARNYVLCSPAKRCQQTCELLFNHKPLACMNEFAEFDCSGLGKNKFWEITREEFENLVPLKPEEMAYKAKDIFINLVKQFNYEHIEHCTIISHGMFIRYLYHYLIGNKDISAYDVINSKGFKFSNLDLMIYDTETNEISVYNYKDPVNHSIC